MPEGPYRGACCVGATVRRRVGGLWTKTVGLGEKFLRRVLPNFLGGE